MRTARDNCNMSYLAQRSVARPRELDVQRVLAGVMAGGVACNLRAFHPADLPVQGRARRQHLEIAVEDSIQRGIISSPRPQVVCPRVGCVRVRLVPQQETGVCACELIVCKTVSSDPGPDLLCIRFSLGSEKMQQIRASGTALGWQPVMDNQVDGQFKSIVAAEDYGVIVRDLAENLSTESDRPGDIVDAEEEVDRPQQNESGMGGDCNGPADAVSAWLNLSGFH